MHELLKWHQSLQVPHRGIHNIGLCYLLIQLFHQNVWSQLYWPPVWRYDIVPINHSPRKANVSNVNSWFNLRVKRSTGWVDGLCHGSHVVNRKLTPDPHKFLCSELYTLSICHGKMLEVTGETKLCMLFPIFSDDIKLLLVFVLLFCFVFLTLILKSTTVTWMTRVRNPPIHRTFKRCHGFFSIS